MKRNPWHRKQCATPRRLPARAECPPRCAAAPPATVHARQGLAAARLAGDSPRHTYAGLRTGNTTHHQNQRR
eukprot:3932386-Rhodomonas_salina.1